MSTPNQTSQEQSIFIAFLIISCSKQLRAFQKIKNEMRLTKRECIPPKFPKIRAPKSGKNKTHICSGCQAITHKIKRGADSLIR
jgi:hypothetical protein